MMKASLPNVKKGDGLIKQSGCEDRRPKGYTQTRKTQAHQQY